jgi:enoyl-CoA hydratase/carnithine racemase
VDGSQGLVATNSSPELHFPALVDSLPALMASARGLSARRIDALGTIVVTKTAPGLTRDTVDALRSVIREIRENRLGRVDFLVLDLAHQEFALSTGEGEFDDLLIELETLILAAPVVSIACARANLAGADLELALACSMMVASETSRFSLAGDPLVSVGAYAVLAQKIGFVRAERLMESAEVLDAAEMRELCLIKDTFDADVADPIAQFLDKIGRRHNAWCGIYRAQRITARSVHEMLRTQN